MVVVVLVPAEVVADGHIVARGHPKAELSRVQHFVRAGYRLPDGSKLVGEERADLVFHVVIAGRRVRALPRKCLPRALEP